MPFDTEPIADANLDDAISFMRSANPFAQLTWGWDTGRFIDWRWGGNTLRDRAEPGFFARHGTMVRRDDGVAALVLAEVGADDHCILTAAEDPEVVAAALTRLIEQYTRERLTFFPSDEASWLHEILGEHGFQKADVAGLEWAFDLARFDDAVHPPEGFIIDSLSADPDGDYTEIDRCLEGAFGGSRDRVPILRSLATNPLFRPELNVVARSSDGRIAAYCRGTVDPDSGVCGIDPVATHPDFQGRGLGKAILRACFATQARLGGRTSYIGSAPEPSPGSRLYRSLGPASVTVHSTWSKQLA